jgi:predicted DNA-binding protein
MPRKKDPNAKRYKKQTAFRLNEELSARLEAYRHAHAVPPTRTSLLEAALWEFLERHEPLLKVRKAA